MNHRPCFLPTCKHLCVCAECLGQPGAHDRVCPICGPISKVPQRERLAARLPSYTLKAKCNKSGDPYEAWPYQEQRATGSAGLPSQHPSSLFVQRAALAVKAWGFSEKAVTTKRAGSLSSVRSLEKLGSLFLSLGSRSRFSLRLMRIHHLNDAEKEKVSCRWNNCARCEP